MRGRQRGGPADVACKNCGYPLGQAATPPAAAFASQILPANTANFVPDGVANGVVYAGFWRRFAAAFIDAIILLVVFVIADILLGVIVGTQPGSAFAALSSAISLGLGIAYYVGLESGSHQATFGKRALGIIVTDLHGKRISNGRATGRYFAKFLSTLILLIGYLMAAFTQNKQALQDMIAGTLVVVKPTSG